METEDANTSLEAESGNTSNEAQPAVPADLDEDELECRVCRGPAEEG